MRGLFIGGALVGVLFGFGLGIGIARFYWPSPFLEAHPADLRLDLKDDYLRMIASSYSLDGDMARALQRFQSLHLVNPIVYVSDLVLRESNLTNRRALGQLAVDLKQPEIALARPTFTPLPTRVRPRVSYTPSSGRELTATPVSSPSPSPSPKGAEVVEPTAFPQVSPSPFAPPTIEPSPTPAGFTQADQGPYFNLLYKSSLNCMETQGRGMIEVEVQDTAGRPLPGIGIGLTGEDGEQVFYTGLMPERGIGYGDVQVPPGSYALELIENANSALVENISIVAEPGECHSDSSETRGWKLVFRQKE